MKINELANKDLSQLLKLMHRSDNLTVLPGKMNQDINALKRLGAYVRVQNGGDIKVFFIGVNTSDDDALIIEFLGDNAAPSLLV